MLLSHWLIHFFCCSDVLQKCSHAAKRSDNTNFNLFVAATSRRKSNQFEFVRLVAATKFCCSDNDFDLNSPVHTKRFVAATCRRDPLHVASCVPAFNVAGYRHSLQEIRKGSLQDFFSIARTKRNFKVFQHVLEHSNAKCFKFLLV